MIKSNYLKYISSIKGLDFYLFKPSISRLYYNDSKKEQWPRFRKTFAHKIHMFLYLFFGGYRILYVGKGNEILSYFIYKRGGSFTVKGSSKHDFYTIYLFTYPEYRGKGIANLMTHFLTRTLENEYDCWCKTIDIDNYSSIAVAEKNGFVKFGNASVKGPFKRVVPNDNGVKYFYKLVNDKKLD